MIVLKSVCLRGGGNNTSQPMYTLLLEKKIFFYGGLNTNSNNNEVIFVIFVLRFSTFPFSFPCTKMYTQAQSTNLAYDAEEKYLEIKSSLFLIQEKTTSGYNLQ